MNSIKARVLASFGFATTKELKAALVAKGHNLNLRLKASWVALDDPSNGIVWVLKQEAKRRAVDPKAIAARVDEKKAEVSQQFKYRTYETKDLVA
ncbi:MAG: hypothetical protein RMY34_23290 [Aulosira sp. DedQUE10]|nr:hypothetical protein [Aulosira sp. DedQUE10]